MEKSIRKFVTLILIVCSGALLHAQSFNASVDKTTVSQYERFQVYFTFEGESIHNLTNFRPPSFEGFRILSGPNQSTSMQIINGKVSASLTYSYILQPSDIGKFTIGEASVDYDGKTYKTEPITINVVKGSPQENKSAAGGISQEELSKSVFILAEASKTRAYVGEQITVTYKLYTKVNIASPQISKLPQYQGFWAEEIEPRQTINFTIGTYKGERYRVAEIKKVALFPTRAGVLNVTPFELNVPVIIRRKRTGNDIFDEFFNDSFFGRTETIEYTARSNTLKINVLPLPSENVPASFNGAVGNFTLKTEIDRKEAYTNESITLRYTISGTGNIKLLTVPEPLLPAGIEKYEPKVYENINRGSVISGQKIAEYLIVPRTPGKKVIPSTEFSYFNPSTHKYVTIKSPEYEINVLKGVGEYESAASGFSKEDIKLLSEDIRYIKTSDLSLTKKEEAALIKPWFWIILFASPFVLTILILFNQRKEKIESDVRLLKYRKAEKAAKKRLKAARKALDNNDIEKFYSELSSALFGYLEDKLGIDKSEFTIELALDKLTAYNVPGDLLNKIKDISEKCEFVRFAPKSETVISANEFYDAAVKTIVEIDSYLEKRK